MSDFAQAGLICTLQRLNEPHLAQIEAELPALADARPISLILPCHAGELERPALRHICAQLADAPWLREVVVSLNGLSANQLPAAREAFRQLPNARLLWTDSPELQPLLADLLRCEPARLPHGKGLNVWAAAGLILADNTTRILATQDADVASFQRATLARLCYACAHPELGFAFAKMYYSRVTDRLYGRVSRLFLTPLLQAILRVAGHQPLLDFLLSFRYPLAGECAVTREAAAALPISAGWGLEIGLLCDLFRNTDPREICQVDGGGGYDHKHQAAAPALERMAREIAAALVHEMAVEGCPSDAGFRTALTSAYRREAALALRRFSALAIINHLPFDHAAESAIVDSFAAALDSAQPGSNHKLPPWKSLGPDTAARLAEYVIAPA